MSDSNSPPTAGIKPTPTPPVETTETPEAYSERLIQAFVSNLKRSVLAEDRKHEAKKFDSPQRKGD